MNLKLFLPCTAVGPVIILQRDAWKSTWSRQTVPWHCLNSSLDYKQLSLFINSHKNKNKNNRYLLKNILKRHFFFFFVPLNDLFIVWNWQSLRHTIFAWLNKNQSTCMIIFYLLVKRTSRYIQKITNNLSRINK